MKTETDWSNLIKEIKKGSCALFLGHGLLSDSNGVSMYAGFCDKLASEYTSLIDMYYPEENFFLFKALQNRRKFTNHIDDFYNKLEPDTELYQMLAEIPVSLYISASPDNFLEKVMGEEAQVTFFNDPKNRGTEIEASKEKPLIYHIFGSTQDSNSLLLSHDDLFEFFKSILGGQSLPTTIKKFFKEGAGGEVVFLGFSFKKWYVQLLLRLFNLSKSDNQLNRTAYLNMKPAEEEASFATQHFQVEFIETNIKEFVSTLHQKCKEQGILRQVNASKAIATSVIVEDRKQRVEQLKKLLVEKNRLLNDWEEKQLYADDPRELARCEMEIGKLKEEIEKQRAELKSYAS